MPAKKDDGTVTNGNGAPAQPAPAPGPAPAPVFIVPAPVAPASTGPSVKFDESIPGGRFLVRDKLVNSEGQRIHDDGTLLTPDEIAAEG